jgi:outer membrane biosynthesis protein TonB
MKLTKKALISSGAGLLAAIALVGGGVAAATGAFTPAPEPTVVPQATIEETEPVVQPTPEATVTAEPLPAEPAPAPVVEPAPAPAPPPAPVGPTRCPAGSTANSNDGTNDTSCFPDVCFTITVPDPAHPECDYSFKP